MGVNLMQTDDDKIYYHGTWTGHAYAIMSQGFALGHEGHGNMLGRGVYVAQQLQSAALWTPDFVIVCQLRPGTRILWVDDSYDRKVIGHLRREFGQELLDLGPHFHQAILANKRLTQKELIHLCSYLLMRAHRQRVQTIGRGRKGKVARYHDAWLRLSRLHGEVKGHGYEAIGDRSGADWDSDEILVFNPARVMPVSAHWLYRAGEDEAERFWLSEALTQAELQLISARAVEQEEEEQHQE
ncbi:MAG TPA: hypothetical protein PLD25_26715 [Chloroflexota bacterium]|nr:hypothetical protein [Chloroflexota bacterium]HUM67505.1 hypothetical protein [Chloroflexota bacterium]